MTMIDPKVLSEVITGMHRAMREEKMGNMSYCRFENTLHDLRGCIDYTDGFGTREEFLASLSESEAKAAKELLRQCRMFVERYPVGV